MTPGNESFFKKHKTCHDCGQPCTKSRCIPCAIKVNYTNKRRHAQQALKGEYGLSKKTKIRQESVKRRTQTSHYRTLLKEFVAQHPICPITGRPTDQCHHSAHREGAWINLRYYWIAVSAVGHRIIEDNPEWAFANHLRVKVNALYNHHVSALVNEGIDIDEPLFYTIWNGSLIPRP